MFNGTFAFSAAFDFVVPQLEHKTKLRIGTAGWSIPARNRIEFPQTGRSLEKYAQRFNAVEINSSFYRPHKQATYTKWSTQVPNDFSFSVKLPRRITHELRLREIAQPLGEFEDQVAGLGSKLGCVLVQLPPSLKFSQDDAWWSFHALREAFKCALICEPHHLSWFSKDVESLFVRLGIARAAADPPPCEEASRPAGEHHTRYYRLRGSPDIYYSNYGAAELQSHARAMGQHMQGSEVWCIFDNTANGGPRQTPYQCNSFWPRPSKNSDKGPNLGNLRRAFELGDMTRVHPHYSPPKDHRVYPETFVFQILSLQRTWPETDNDYILVTAGLTVARIYLVTLAGQRPAWHWVITGPAIPCEIYPHQGMAESLSDAEGMVRQKFNAWLSWALQRGHTALWHGADSRWLDSMRAYSHEPRPLTATIYMERNHGS